MRLLVCLLVLLVAAAPAHAQAQVAPDQQALILARVLAYDRNLLERAGADVVVAVVHAPADAASVEDGRRMLAAFKALERIPLKGKPFRAVSVPYSAAALADAHRTLGVDAVYLCQGLYADVGSIVSSARKLKITTMAGTSAYESTGVAVGLTVEEGKPRLLVNATASREEGAHLSSELLRFAKVSK